MTIQVYKIDTYESKGNSHSIGIREENWFLRKDKVFDIEEDAKEYVRNQNRLHTILPTYLITLKTQAEKDAFVDYFCFDPNSKYLHERRYFLQRPSSRKITDELRKNGIRIVN